VPPPPPLLPSTPVHQRHHLLLQSGLAGARSGIFFNITTGALYQQ
jgi:hypothetical protein